ncbi:MAG TPA: aconitate hydratase AcnA [Gammaproteobacteria bacterium]|nr:aconitate hydratase AcnA [Gammaproteobacteria bacterium]
MKNSFDTRSRLTIDSTDYEIFSVQRLADHFPVGRLPYTHKILLENLLRHEDDINVASEDIEALANWNATEKPSKEIAFTPARVLMQDFTGVPAIVDLAAMRDAMRDLGGDPDKINPLSPAELVIDHSVQVDVFGNASAAEANAKIEFERNQERYSFLRWGQQAFSNFKVVPPDTGIVHQVNLEFLARTVFSVKKNGVLRAYPDTVVGTDSHTTMINGVGVLGWGVGGIEAEAAMLGQPITMLIPQVIGFKLTGELPEAATATDLVLQVVEMLRKKGVVGKFVEFFGPGLNCLPLADRATIANMAPEYGATCGIFPIDAETIRYLTLSGRRAEHIALVEGYAKETGMWRETGSLDAVYSDTLSLDMGQVEPSLAGPKRPQDRIPLKSVKKECAAFLAEGTKNRLAGGVSKVVDSTDRFDLTDGAVVIAAITSCTNTSNPYVMMAAGLLAKNASERGLESKPWVKTSLAPGSLVVTSYLKKAGVASHLDALGFQNVGYGCTTCIGNSGPLPPNVSSAIKDGDLIVCSVLSGNRNFEGRVHAEVKMNFLASPPLVVAYALAGTLNFDMSNDPLGRDYNGDEVFLKDIWPSTKEVNEAVAANVDSKMFTDSYESVFDGDTRWSAIEVPAATQFEWNDSSTYVKHPPYFVDMKFKPEEIKPINGARVLALLGDSITTDHISPAGAIKADSPAGQYLIKHGVEHKNFNSYGSRRGNHEVMMRGTFANIRLRNQLAPGTEGGWTTHQPSGDLSTIYDAAIRYQEEQVPLIIIAGKEYGTGSSRDWAAKGTLLLGARVVIAESFERIHRSNLVGMGVLPLVFQDGENATSLALTGKEAFNIEGLEVGAKTVTIIARGNNAKEVTFQCQVRVDTPKEWEYYRNGGILHYVLRELAT